MHPTDDELAGEQAEGVEMGKGEEKLSDLPVYLNGTAKAYMGVIVFLWSALVGLGSWAVGSSSSGASMLAHAENGHPVQIQRISSLERLLTVQLRSIDDRLERIERQVDGLDGTSR